MPGFRNHCTAFFSPNLTFCGTRPSKEVIPLFGFNLMILIFHERFRQLDEIFQPFESAWTLRMLIITAASLENPTKREAATRAHQTTKLDTGVAQRLNFSCSNLMAVHVSKGSGQNACCLLAFNFSIWSSVPGVMCWTSRHMHL